MPTMKIYSLETRNKLIYSWHRMLDDARNQCTTINELPKEQRRSRSLSGNLSGVAHIVEWLILPDDAERVPTTARMVHLTLHHLDTGNPTRPWFTFYINPIPGWPIEPYLSRSGYVIRRFMEMGHAS